MEIIAHRGASFAAPENTLEAIRLAWNLGADAVEIDVRLSKDGELILLHDATFKRTTGVNQAVAALTVEAISKLHNRNGEAPPTLKGALEIIPPEKRIYVEVKIGMESLPPLSSILGAGVPNVSLITFDYSLAAALKKALPGSPVLWLVKECVKKPELLKKTLDAGLDGLDLNGHHTGVDAKFINAAHETGLKICVWTVNDTKLGARLAKAGVDGLTTDRPDLFVAQS